MAKKKVTRKKSAKPTKRDKAVRTARSPVPNGLYDFIMSDPTLAEVNKIIGEEVKKARLTKLEEWYLDKHSCLLRDSELEINIEDKDDVENESADHVGTSSEDEVEERLSEAIVGDKPKTHDNCLSRCVEPVLSFGKEAPGQEERPMDPKTVRKLEKELLQAIADVILRLGLEEAAAPAISSHDGNDGQGGDGGVRDGGRELPCPK